MNFDTDTVDTGYWIYTATRLDVKVAFDVSHCFSNSNLSISKILIQMPESIQCNGSQSEKMKELKSITPLFLKDQNVLNP